MKTATNETVSVEKAQEMYRHWRRIGDREQTAYWRRKLVVAMWARDARAQGR